MRIITDSVFYTRLALFLAIIMLGAGGYFWLSRPAPETPPRAVSPIDLPPPPPATTSPSIPPPPTTHAPTQKKCVISGCSRQLCINAADVSGGITTCEFKNEYACYKTATCTVQADGACGWTQTAQLKTCVSTARCGAPPDQPSPPAGCRYEGASSCADGQWNLPRLVCQ